MSRMDLASFSRNSSPDSRYRAAMCFLISSIVSPFVSEMWSWTTSCAGPVASAGLIPSDQRSASMRSEIRNLVFPLPLAPSKRPMSSAIATDTFSGRLSGKVPSRSMVVSRSSSSVCPVGSAFRAGSSFFRNVSRRACSQARSLFWRKRKSSKKVIRTGSCGLPPPHVRPGVSQTTSAGSSRPWHRASARPFGSGSGGRHTPRS